MISFSCSSNNYDTNDGSYDINNSDDNSENTDDEPFDDIIMFEASQLTVRDVMTLTMAFSIRFKLSDIGREHLIDMIKLLAGPASRKVNISKYRFQQTFDHPDDKIKYHYYCDICNKTIIYSGSHENITRKKITCLNCSTQSEININSKNYFMSIDLTYQLKMLVKNQDIKKEILQFQDSINRNKSNESVEDIYDSEQYKKINNENIYLTYNVSTDGAPLTKSGKRGFWPLQILPNFLPPKSRFKFILLAGMLTTTKEPNSDLCSLYFSKFNEEALRLYREGIVTTNLNNKVIVVKFCPLAFSVDSVCRPILQNRLQFNGYYGCSWCYHIGVYVKDVSGIRYPMQITDPDLRSKENYIRDVQVVISTKKISERGVKGKTSVSIIPQIDMIWSFSFDYLHGLLAGVDQQIYKQWTSTKTQCNFKLNHSDIKAIEKRLLTITPTHDIHRLPRSLKDRGKWKASEIKSWVLYYSLPCLGGIIKDEALEHYSLLVKSFYTLLKTKISQRELVECERDLLKFTGLYEIMYGTNNMTFNVHSLLHVVHSIKKTGPLWSNSTFPFESNIYKLKQFVNGPNGMDKQISRKHLQMFHFKTGNIEYSSVEIRDFCSNLFTFRRLSTYFDYGENNVLFVGKRSIDIIDGKLCKLYKKCIYRGKVLHSIKYTRTKRTQDSVVKLESSIFGQIVDIISSENKCYLKISNINLFEDDPFKVPHIKKIKSENFERCKIIPITHIKSKVMLVNVHNSRYICELTNDFESQ
ncbi:PREDICTED: uncharacterized protein LOC105566468 [Vollenhovia emeryi]|uniref:uncharacterized protein LOC105566468 n=1 Tax=Vollenhovia emeryi TaxID=411798 RepID=UPI0005F3D754|nr:PREDICTED: uncharacterized protein LOC105566468 [Vollenhovia emeryi]